MKKTLLAILVSLVITGCNNATQKADASYQETKRLADQAIKSQTLQNGSAYKIDQKGIYVDKTPIDTTSFDTHSNLPKSFNKRVVVNDQDSKSIGQLAAFLTKITGQKVVIQQDLVDGTLGTSGVVIGKNAVSASSAERGAEGVVDEIIYTGTVKGLFDHITSKLNVFWKYDNGIVEIYKYETKLFSLDVLSGTSKTSASLSTSNISSAESNDSNTKSEANSGQQTQIDNVVSIWEEVTTAIQSVLSENEKFAVTPSAGKITVMATPAHMRKVENLIKTYNEVYSRQVRLDVKVFQVEQDDQDNYGINWTSVWEKANSKFGLNINMGGGLDSSVVTISNKFGNDARSLNTSAIIDALSTAGKTSLLRNNTVTTLNNRTVPLSVAREIAYVQSTSVTTSDSNTSTQINPGVVTEGFSMNLTPLINDKGEILMQYSVDSSTVEAIDNFSSSDGKSTVQLPRRSVSHFLQKVAMQNGESMVLTGFQEVKGQHTDKGIGSASAWAFGGSRKSESKFKTIVVVVTPYILK